MKDILTLTALRFLLGTILPTVSLAVAVAVDGNVAKLRLQVWGPPSLLEPTKPNIGSNSCPPGQGFPVGVYISRVSVIPPRSKKGKPGAKLEPG